MQRPVVIPLSEDEKKLKQIIQFELHRAGVLPDLTEAQFQHFCTVYTLKHFRADMNRIERELKATQSQSIPANTRKRQSKPNRKAKP